jgi:hypothetical protein
VFSIDQKIAEIESYLYVGHHTEAEKYLSELIYSLNSKQFEELSGKLELLSRRFQRKREVRLLQCIEERRQQDAKLNENISEGQILASKVGTDIRAQLVTLSDTSIFDWSTAYKQYVRSIFDKAIASWTDQSTRGLFLREVKKEFSRHAREIFEKGYCYKSDSLSEEGKITKSMRGLISFLELPLQESLDRISTTRLSNNAQICRQVSSAMISGIVEGYALCSFGDQAGLAVLKSDQKWYSFLGLITGNDFTGLERVICSVPGFFQAREFLLPLNEALDRLPTPNDNDFFFVRNVSWDNRFQSITLELVFPMLIGSTKSVRIAAFLNSELISISGFEQLLNRDVASIIAPLNEVMVSAIEEHAELREIVVDTKSTSSHQSASQAKQIVRIIQSHVARLISGNSSASVILTHNYAEDFPLENSRVPPRFYVDRPSVRRLVPALNSRLGIRLWTSMRRSGKTTSCLQLAKQSGSQDVIFQTCQFTDQEEYTNFFYDQVVQALQAGHLPKDFLSSFFKRYVGISSESIKDLVLIIDEYETLFEYLELKSNATRLLQLDVVQPLLNQLTAFAQSNLLVLLGQRPDAHFINMDQNQLSPLVQYDPFPLFEHDQKSQSSEFCELISKTLTFHVPFELSFANSVFAETHGHPYLTVCLLRDLLDFLIKMEKWTTSSLLTAEEFNRYAEVGFSIVNLRRSKHYAFFRKMVAEYLSNTTFTRQPWLFAVHDMMNELTKLNTEMKCSEFDFGTIFGQRGLDKLNLDANTLMDNAVNGNFLSLENGFITPRVPLIARLANCISRP